MHTVLSQLRYSARRLGHAPMFTLVSVVTLALGIGATSAIFSVVHGVLLKPLPFEEPEQLVGVRHAAPGLGFDETNPINQSPALHFTYQDESRAFDDIGMWDYDQVTITGVGEPERMPAMNVTHGTLRLLRARPVVGRIFSERDDSPGSPETVVLSNGYWHRRFGGREDVIGETMTIDGRPREIIGVLPARFRFLRFNPDVFIPFQFDRSELFIGNFSYQGIARLKDGVTVEQANDDVNRMVPLAADIFPFPTGFSLEMMKQAHFAANVHPLIEDVIGDIGATLWVILGTVAIVLLIACANVANLFLVRADGRQRELALRTALGADKARVARELLGESILLGALGGVSGLGVAWAAIRVLVAIAPETLPRLESITIDSTVLAVTAALALTAGVFFGLVPVLKYTRPNIVGALKEGGRTSSDGHDRQRARGALVIAQVALALVLLVAAGLMIRSFQALREVHPGFVEPEDVLTFRLSIPETQVADNADVPDVHRELMNAVQAIPGVRSVGLSSSITMDGSNSNDPIYVEEFPIDGEQLPPLRRFKWVSPGYFETMGNPVIAGRSITWDDVRMVSAVVVVSETFALEYWDTPTAAIGKRIRVTPADKWREIVGVVGNIHDDGVDQDVTPVMFWPMSVTDLWGGEIEFARRNMAYAVRTSRANDTSFLPQIREAVWSIAPNVPIANIRTLDEILAVSMNRTTFTLIMLGIASVVALLIGAVGLYGVISYGVSQRIREIGVRMALGAQRSDVSALFMRHAAILAALGVAVGLAFAFLLTRSMSALLFNVSPADPVTYGLVSFALVGVALLASYIPARRASAVNPTRALHWE